HRTMSTSVASLTPHFHHPSSVSSIFFFNDPATTEIYTLSLHDALPISLASCRGSSTSGRSKMRTPTRFEPTPTRILRRGRLCRRSEEHTSELQSRRDLVCRLLLEKKKKKKKLQRRVKQYKST